MEISIGGSLAMLAGGSPVEGWIAELHRARDAGFRRVWIAQMPWDPDLLTLMAVAFQEVSGIELGTAVVPIQAQHPMIMAQRALTLSLISSGRFILGLGLTHRIVTEDMWGIAWDKPVRRMNEYLDGLTPLLNQQPAHAVGQTVTTRGSLSLPITKAPPIYIAALGSQMLQLAGRRSAGTVTWMTGPKTLANHVGPTLREAAERAGRPVGDVRVVAALPISVTDDADAARAAAAEALALYGTLPSYQSMLEREGYADPADAAIIGDEDAVLQQIDGLRAIGVDEFVGSMIDTDPEGRARTMAALSEYRRDSTS